MYFAATGAQLTDINKIRFTMLMMVDKAQAWRDAQLRRWEAAPAEGGVPWPTWEAFKTLFKQCWGETNKATKALRELQKYTWITHWKTPIEDILTQLKTLIR